MRESALTRSVVLVLVAIVFVQFGSSLAKSLFDQAPPWGIAWLRLLGSATVLLTVVRPRLRGRTRRDWGLVALYGLALTGMNALFYLAIQRIPIGTAVTVEFLGPLTVAVLGTRRWRDVTWVVLAGVGVTLLGFRPEPLDVLGVVLAGLAGACWGAYIVVSRPVGRAWEGVSALAVGSALGGIVLTPIVLVTEPGRWVLQADVVATGLLLGVVASAIPYGLELRALRTMDRRVFGILMSLEPAVAAGLAWLVLRESLGPWELLAMACVVVASAGAVRSASRVDRHLDTSAARPTRRSIRRRSTLPE